MGRYIYSSNEEINGYKFWFGLQPTDAIFQFGADVEQTYRIDDRDEIVKGINKIKEQLDERYIELFDLFFESNDGYNDKMIIDFSESINNPISADEVKDKLGLYADLYLGKRLLKAFDAEQDGELVFTTG